jgi:phosphate-selective porin OprO and OprP
MTRTIDSSKARWISMMTVVGTLAGWCAGAMGQGESPSVPPIDTLPPTAVSPSDSQRELLDRLRRMEVRLDQVTKQNEELSREVQELKSVNRDQSQKFPPARMESRPNVGQGGGSVGGSGSSYRISSSLGGGSSSGGGDPTTTERAQVVGNRRLGKLPLAGGYYDYANDGLRWGTDDDEFNFGIRAMQQIDARIYANPNQEYVSSGITNPRTRVYFYGHLTRPFSYEFSFQESYDTLNLLDSYINYRYSDGFNLQFGRYKSPFTYEWYRIHIWNLLAPERSLFSQNFSGQRRFGLMAHGDLFNKRMEYAVGSFDGQRNGYSEFNSHQDVLAFLNFKPFYNREGSWLRDLQFGGSVDAGIENNPLTPAVLTTSAPESPSGLTPGSPAVPFLAFNNNVRERGLRELWELHTAYYYKGLSLLGAWDSGTQDYALGASGPAPVRVPTSGYFVQAGYILTGETIRDRTLLDPLRPFDLRPGHFGLGAFEVTARFSELQLGRQVFTGGLADSSLWTNQAQMVDAGFNWYLNRFIKVYFDWEHAMFANPVFYNTGQFQKSNDLYWLRVQLYF